MQENKRAFTLIELLVVVLIISILSAIALPQYTKAVEKSRLAEVFTIVPTLQHAIDLYVLENGYPTTNVGISFLGNEENGNDMLTMDVSHLDCNIRNGSRCGSKNFYYAATCDSDKTCRIVVERRGQNGWYQFEFYKNNTNAWQGSECDYESGDSIGEKICKSLEAQGNGFYACENC